MSSRAFEPRRAAPLALLVCCLGLPMSTASQAAPSAPASDPVFSRPLDSSSRAALGDSFGKLSERPVVAGAFTLTKRVKRLGRDLVSKGDFLLSAKDGIYWDIKSPYPSTLVLTSKRIVQRSPDGEESVIDAADNAVFKRIAETMQSVFSGNLGALEGEFSVYFQGDASSWRLGLVPKEKTVRDLVASIVVEGSSTVSRLSLAEGNGDVVDYRFQTARTADGLTESERGLFVF